MAPGHDEDRILDSDPWKPSMGALATRVDPLVQSELHGRVLGRGAPP